MRRSPRLPSVLLIPIASATLMLAAGCFSVTAYPDGGDFDGGTVNLSRDSGFFRPPSDDAGYTPPAPDAGPPEVSITTFEAGTTTLGYLDDTYLTWAVQAATSCSMSPDIGAVTLPGGSYLVESGAPDNVQTFTLTCQGNGGPVSRTVTITTTLVSAPGATVTTAAQLSSFAGVNVVTGDLVIDGPTSSDLSNLETLVEVEGSLIVGNMASLTAGSLPNLERVGRGLAFDENSAMTTLDLPKIDRVEGKLYVSRNFQLPQSEIDDVVTTLQAGSGIGGPVVDFYNRTPNVLSALNQTMLCLPSNEAALWRLDFYVNGAMDVYAPGPILAGSGTYEESQGQLRMNVAGVFGGGTETTSSLELEYDRIAKLVSPSFTNCYLWQIAGSGVFFNTTFECTNVTSGSNEERNSVTIAPNGEAQWTYTFVHPSLPGGQASQVVPGAYVQDGDWFLFAFAQSISPLTTLRFPTGRLNGAQTELHFDDFVGGQNPCTAQ
jgi:hypothetical protein